MQCKFHVDVYVYAPYPGVHLCSCHLKRCSLCKILHSVCRPDEVALPVYWHMYAVVFHVFRTCGARVQVYASLGMC